MSTEGQPIKVGDRFEDTDPRQGNRVIRIIKAPTLSAPARYEVEVAEFNPKTVGDQRKIKASTIRERYRRISR